MRERNQTDRLDKAMRMLPPSMRRWEEMLSEEERDEIEEIRLRRGRYPSVLIGNREQVVGDRIVTGEDLERLMETATGASVHTVTEHIRRGFVTAPGGYRIGLCGTVSQENGTACGMQTVSSAAIRIPREVKGVADSVVKTAFPGGVPVSCLILSPPGGGKTTLLRDMLRLCSDRYGLRTAVADERGELAAMAEGVPTMDVGNQTDVLDGCPKAEAAIRLIRGMNPQVLVMDEVTAQEDAEALREAACCGVILLASVHGRDRQEVLRRPILGEMVRQGIFRSLIFIEHSVAGRRYRVEAAEQ